jgi:hypothetical protein
LGRKLSSDPEDHRMFPIISKITLLWRQLKFYKIEKYLFMNKLMEAA